MEQRSRGIQKYGLGSSTCIEWVQGAKNLIDYNHACESLIAALDAGQVRSSTAKSDPMSFAHNESKKVSPYNTASIFQALFGGKLSGSSGGTDIRCVLWQKVRLLKMSVINSAGIAGFPNQAELCC